MCVCGCVHSRSQSREQQSQSQSQCVARAKQPQVNRTLINPLQGIQTRPESLNQQTIGAPSGWRWAWLLQLLVSYCFSLLLSLSLCVALPKRLKLPTQLVSYQRLIKNFVQLPKVQKIQTNTGSGSGNRVQSFVIFAKFQQKAKATTAPPTTTIPSLSSSLPQIRKLYSR